MVFDRYSALNPQAGREVMSKSDLKESWKTWAGRYAWSFFVTLTFRYDVTEEKAVAALKRFLKRLNRSVYGERSKRRLYIFAVQEYTKSDRIHFHLLFSGDTPKHDRNELRREMTRLWSQVPYASPLDYLQVHREKWFQDVVTDGVLDYVLKDLTPDNYTVMDDVLNLPSERRFLAAEVAHAV